MQEIYNLIEDLKDIETTVLITGPSGTGKELVARAIHYSGARAHRPFVVVNCSALAENLLESELFGHVKGAFTGAIRDREGRFQLANQGTIFLDEIGDISPRIQLKLLRVLENKEIERVGDSTPLKLDVQVISATNADLMDKVRKGQFREDLYLPPQGSGGETPGPYRTKGRHRAAGGPFSFRLQEKVPQGHHHRLRRGGEDIHGICVAGQCPGTHPHLGTRLCGMPDTDHHPR